MRRHKKTDNHPNNNPENFPNKTKKLDSADNLATIKSLQISIQELVKQINTPFASLISIILIPVIWEIFYPNRYVEVNKEYSALNNNVNEITTFLTKTKGDKFFKQNPNFDENNNELKRKIIEIYRNIIRLNLKKPSTSHNLDINNLESYSIKEITDELDRYYNTFQESVDSLMKDGQGKLETLGSDIRYGYYLTAVIKMIPIILGQRYLINPLVMHVFPNGILQKPTPQKNTNAWLSKKEAAKFIRELQAHEQELKEQAVLYNTITLVGSVTLGLTAFYWLDYTAPSAEIFVLTLTVLSTTVNNLVASGYEWYSNYQLQTTLTKKENDVRVMLGNVRNVTIKPVNYGTLKSSYLSIFFSDVRLLKIFKNCLVSQQIKVTSHSRKSINIPVDAMDTKKINVIKKFFAENLQRLDNIKLLKKQLLTLAESLKFPFICEPQIDRKKLPIATFELIVPLQMQETFTNSQQLFKNNTLEIKAMEDAVKVTIIGNSPLPDNEFKIFKNELVAIAADPNRSGPPKKYQPSFFDSEANSQGVTHRSGKKEKESMKHISKADQIRNANKQLQKEVNRIAHWSDCQYNSQAENCEINPLRSGQVYDKKFFETCKKFTRNIIRSNQFPTTELHDAVCALIQNSPIVPGKGKSGLVYETGWETDQDGEWFFYSLKGKLLGHAEAKGDLRVYAVAETNDQGETLYTFKGVNFDSH